MGRSLGIDLQKVHFGVFLGIYCAFIFVDYLLTKSSGEWHLLAKGAAFAFLLIIISNLNFDSIKLSITVYLTIALSVFSLSYWRIGSELFLFYINLIRLVEVFFATVAIQMLQKKIYLEFKTNWRSISIIVLIALAFIGLVFNFFEEKLQFIILIRMTQVALLASLVLFNRHLHWFLSFWILAMVGADFLAGLRIINYVPSSTIHLQHAIHYFSFLFFAFGVYYTLDRYSGYKTRRKIGQS